MKFTTAIAGGFAGATALTILHQLLRMSIDDAPHMDELGMEALEKGLIAANQDVPDNTTLYYTTMAGDLIANTAYYSAIGIGGNKHVLLRGALVGLAAGIGGVLLPKPMGLDEKKSTRTTTTQFLTIALYTFGGLVTSLVLNKFAKNSN